MTNKPKILFTSTFITPFIKTDRKILEKYFTVIQVSDSGSSAIINYLKKITKAQITFSWFASVYSSFLVVIGKLLNKKSIIILGGVDLAKEKEIDYGIWNSKWKSTLVKYAIKNASQILAVDKSLKDKAIELCNYSGVNIRILHTGYDSEYWHPSGEKKEFILTVANCDDQRRARVKGIDFLISVAKLTKNVNFVVLGVNEKLIQTLEIPENIKLYPPRPQSEILPFYQSAKIYFQPSYIEGLPNSLCEAMLCECFPMGTNVGGIPTAIGNTGEIIEYGNVQSASEVILKALQECSGKDARKRVVENFSLKRREEELVALINSFI